MKDNTIDFHQTGDELLAFEVSDEALETAVGTLVGNYTLAACTGLSVCPG